MSRTRSRSSQSANVSTQLSSHYTVYDDANWYDSPWAVVTGSGTSKSETTTDVVTPNYKQIICSGGIVNNPFSKTTIETYGPGAVSMRRQIGFIRTPFRGDIDRQEYDTTGTCYPACTSQVALLTPPTADRASCEAEAVTAAYANVDASEMQALASAAESRKTLDSMVDISKRVLRIARSVRKLHFKELYGELSPKELSDRYLEARYAVRPLIIDAAQLCNALEKKREHVRQTFRGKASRTADLSDQVSGVNVAAGLLADLKRTANVTITARAGVLASVEIDEIVNFGLDQLAETAWELTPFSFIIDWFANVGDVIAAWTPNAGITQRASWLTTRVVTSRANSLISGSARWPGTCDYRTIYVAPFSYGDTTTTVERTTDPVASVLPVISINLDTFKLIDLGLILRKTLG